MTPYREIIRLAGMNLTQAEIAGSCKISKKTVNRVLQKARELGIRWPLGENETDEVLGEKLYPPSEKPVASTKKMPDYEYIRRELQRNGVNKKLLWTEYLEECRQSGEDPLMYSQFCYYIQKDEEKHRATMHIGRKPGDQIEVDWAGDPAYVIDPDTGEAIKAWLFVAVLSYSQYPYVEAFTTAVVHNNDWYNPQLNTVYHEMAEHYNTAIVPARIRSPKDKPNAEGTVGVISTWITAAIRNEQFFSLSELNQAIWEKLDEFSNRPFQKRDGSRYEIYRDEELPVLGKLPERPYELAEWKVATVQFNYHVSVDGMLYSVPYEYIKRKVDVRITDTTIEIFFNHHRIASHRRLYGRKGQYSTTTEHMPEDHQKYLEWNGDRFRKWAERVGPYTYSVVDAILSSQRVEQQSYRSCMGLLKLADRYSVDRLENACKKALSYTASPSYKSIKNILASGKDSCIQASEKDATSPHNTHAITRGADYWRR